VRCFRAASLWARVVIVLAASVAGGAAAQPQGAPGGAAGARAPATPAAPGGNAPGASTAAPGGDAGGATSAAADGDPAGEAPVDPRSFGAAVSLQVLAPTYSTPQAEVVTSGALDARFQPTDIDRVQHRGGTFWLRLQLMGSSGTPPAGEKGVMLPVLVVREGHDQRVRVFAPSKVELPRAARLPEFGGGHQVAFMLPRGLMATDPLYARVAAPDEGIHMLHFRVSTLQDTLARAASHARMISLVCGALGALSLGALLIWCVLSDRIFLLYTALFSLQCLYIVFLSGQGFEWPLLSHAAPFNSYAWNVPIALSGAAAALFVREMADIRVFSPRAYHAFGWFAVAFLMLTLANFAKPFGFENAVNTFGNVLFLISAVFTLWICFKAWRHGSRAAGWFLLAWVLLEVFNIATTIQLIVTDGETGDALLYSGLPLSMVTAAVLTALGVADRLRGQRIALTEAERRAQTDPLTGVLNRRSLIERLEAACARARTRGLPIALLFIDLDHFKEINDTFGHPAGDACLHAIVGPIQAELRNSDVIGRYGGEEFVVILSSADAAAAQPIAERILRRVADVRVTGYGEPIGLTCSIGIATSDMLGVWGQHLIARADAAVYVAKRAGRNRVQFAEPVAA
jgi:diguanylate cyclase (GGDEF)-like protein